MLKNYFTLFFILALLGTKVYSQPQLDKEKKKTGLTPDSWSLQFGVANNFSLTSFGGTLITAKKHYSRSKAVRIGFIINGRLSDINREQNQIINDILTKNKSSGNNKFLAISFKTLFLNYSTNKGRLNPYWGLGPDIRIDLSKSDNAQSSNLKTETWTWSGAIGVEGVLGMELLLNPNISVFAEYSLSALFRYTKTNHTTKGPGFKRETHMVRKDFIINFPVNTPGRASRTGSSPSTVRFGLSAYF